MIRILILCLVIMQSACGNMLKSGGMVEAQKALDRNAYSEALEYTHIAESFGRKSSEDRARIHYMRAVAQEGLGMHQQAINNYIYVVEKHGYSAYAAPAQQRIDQLSSY